MAKKWFASLSQAFLSKSWQEIHKHVTMFLEKNTSNVTLFFSELNHVTLHRFVAQLPDLHTLLCKPSLLFRNENNFPCAEFDKVDNHWISCGALSCLFQLFMVRLRSRTIVFFQRTSVWLAASTDYLRPVQQAVNFETESDDEAFQMEILLKFALS